MYAVLVSFVRQIIVVKLTVHDHVVPFGSRDDIELCPGNHERNEEGEGGDVKAKEVDDVLHLSSKGKCVLCI